MISIAIKTAHRDPDYLRITLENLKRSGVFESEFFDSLFIVDSYPSDIFHRLPKFVVAKPKIQIDEPQEKRSLHENALQAISLAVSSKTADWVMVLEDDLDFCGNFLDSVHRWLEKHKTSKTQMYVFGANYQQVLNAVQSGESSWDYPVEAFYGAQCCVWRKLDAAHLVEWLGPNPNYDGVTRNGHDLLLQRWGKDQGLKFFLASAPSFVQHIGVESGIGNRYFEFLSFPGPKWVYQ